jgi:hypothetical protein
MLLIIAKGLSYGAPTTLSIPKLPTHSVKLDSAGHEKEGHDLIRLSPHVPELIRQHGAQEAELEPRRDDVESADGDRCEIAIVADRKTIARLILV